MNGKESISKNVIIAALLLLSVLSLPQISFGANNIAILLSDEEKSYETPIASFSSEIGNPVKVYNLRGNIKNAPQIMANIFSNNTSLIFALGAKAAYVAKIWTIDHQEIPVVFAMVINWQRYNLTNNQKNIAGIASDVSPGIQLANMTIFSPEAKKIGVIYSKDHSQKIVSMAQNASRFLDIELIAKPISKPGDFKRTYKEYGNSINGFWILTDPVLYTIENIAWLEKKCINDKLTCIGQSKNVAKFGVLMAVDPDMHSIGVQAAAMSKSILDGKKTPEDIGVMSPIGTKIFLNLVTAEKIGLKITNAAKEMANEIIDQ